MKQLLGLFFLLVLGAGIDLTQTVPVRAEGFSVKEGAPAPDFTLPDQDGKPVTLSSFRGQWVVLYFYPKDDTPGCTKEACSFRDNIVAIQHLNATILGVSVDSVASHKKFSDKHHLNFQILADDQFKVTQQYGTLTRFMGSDIARRSSVIIDPKGIIRKLFPAVEPTDHAREIHQTLKTLQGS
ncbi:MAG: peroxiredoxin [Nitrospirae bacterium]|nr:peroxiredoxin [Candidatus Manganitrophaceae bacterium]